MAQRCSSRTTSQSPRRTPSPDMMSSGRAPPAVSSRGGVGPSAATRRPSRPLRASRISGSAQVPRPTVRTQNPQSGGRARLAKLPRGWVWGGRETHLRLDDRPVPRELQRPPARAAQPIVRHAAVLLALRQRIPRRERDPVVDVEVEVRGQLLVGLGDVAADPGVPSLRVRDLDTV